MRPMLRKGIVLVICGTVLVVALIIYRNMQLDTAVSALKAGDYETTVGKLRLLTIAGDSDAQFLLGQMYAFGWGVAKDENKALEWLRRSARWTKTKPNKAATAAYYIGKDYAEGVGAVGKNEAEAVRWFKIAAEEGSREAANRLARAYAEGLLGLDRDSRQSEYW